MIDRKRRNRRIAAAIGVSLAINGLQFAGIRRLVSAATQEVRIAVQLQPRSLTVSLPRRTQESPEPPVSVTRTLAPTPPVKAKPVIGHTPTQAPTRIAALPSQYRPYPMSDPAPNAPAVRYPLTIPLGPGGVPGLAGDNARTGGRQPDVAISGSGDPAGSDAPGSGSTAVEPVRPKMPTPAHPVEARPSPQSSVEDPKPAVVPAVIHGENRAAKAIATPQPPYPSDARTDGVEGEVILSVSLDARASITAVDVVKTSGDRRLDRAAQRGVRNWQFEPALDDGNPAASTVRVKIRFLLD